MRILHVAETVRGGIATYFNELHAHQCAAFGKENVHYIVPSDHLHDLIGFEEAEVSVFKRSGRSISGLFRMALVTLSYIRRAKPDIIHLHSSFAGLIRPILMLQRHGPRVIYCPHGWAFSRETSQLSHQITTFIERFLAKITDRIICISYDELSEAIHAGMANKRLVLIYNGISSQRPAFDRGSQQWSSPKTKVLFIGRLDRQKGYDLLVEAARRLRDEIDVRVIGSTVIEGGYDLEVPENVSLLGWMSRPAIEAQLEQADLVVIPSRWEAFGLVALEAMRAAKPIVAFRVGALPEIVVDGTTGILCVPASVSELATALQRATTLDLQAVGQRGYARFLRFYDVKKTHRRLRLTYEEVNRKAETKSERQFA